MFMEHDVLPPPASCHRRDHEAFWDHIWTARRGPQAIAWCRGTGSLLRICVMAPSSERFPDSDLMKSVTASLSSQEAFQEKKKKKAFICLTVVFSRCFVSLFSPSGFVPVCGGGGSV